jgi:hypothetical protein
MEMRERGGVRGKSRRLRAVASWEVAWLTPKKKGIGSTSRIQ